MTCLPPSSPYLSCSDQEWIQSNQSTGTPSTMTQPSAKDSTFWEWTFGDAELGALSSSRICIQQEKRDVLVSWEWSREVMIQRQGWWQLCRAMYKTSKAQEAPWKGEEGDRPTGRKKQGCGRQWFWGGENGRGP